MRREAGTCEQQPQGVTFVSVFYCGTLLPCVAEPGPWWVVSTVVLVSRFVIGNSIRFKNKITTWGSFLVKVLVKVLVKGSG